jgi:hypothetical protein
MEFYRRSLVSWPNQEMSMKHSNVQEQSDLFSNVPAPPALATLQLHHDELVDLISRLLWEVVRGPTAQASGENAHEQDQR